MLTLIETGILSSPVVPKLGVATHKWVACRYFGGRVILYIV